MTTLAAPPPPAASPPRRSPLGRRRRLTIEEFFELPQDDGMDRDLIDGELWEEPMTVRTWEHSSGEGMIGYRLQHQIIQNGSRDRVCSGEAGVILPSQATAAGMDIIVVSREDFDRTKAGGTAYFECVPRMVIEVLSPTNQFKKVYSKRDSCLDAGVLLFWIVDPWRGAVMAYRPDTRSAEFAGEDLINADPAVPNFAMPTSKLFDE